MVGLGWYTNFRIYRRDVEDIKNDVEGMKRAALSSLRSEIAAMVQEATKKEFREIRKMRFDLLATEAERWKEKGVHANVVTVAIDMIKVAQELDNEYLIADSLEFLKDAVKSGGLKYASTTLEVTKITDALPNQFSAEVETIRELVRAARSK